MEIIKYSAMGLILIATSYVGILLANKYTNRVKELKQMKIALSLFATKIKFTYEPIPQIFQEIAGKTQTITSKIFQLASEKMEEKEAGTAWLEALEIQNNVMNKEDKEVLKGLSNLLGKVDLDGQIREIELVNTFLNTQIEKAEQESKKNVKMYKTLGITAGLAIVVVLI
ncbi:MAG: stage III sporulation protein AB [Clostridia bacterium]